MESHASGEIVYALPSWPIREEERRYPRNLEGCGISQLVEVKFGGFPRRDVLACCFRSSF